MGSVIEYIECPRCNSDHCFSDFNYKTGEDVIFCSECGYLSEFLYKRDGNGKLIRNDESKGYTHDNLIAIQRTIESPYGSYRVESINGGATCGTLVTEDDYSKFVSEIVSLINQENKIKEAVVSRFVEGKVTKDTLFSRP